MVVDSFPTLLRNLGKDGHSWHVLGQKLRGFLGVCKDFNKCKETRQ